MKLLHKYILFCNKNIDFPYSILLWLKQEKMGSGDLDHKYLFLLFSAANKETKQQSICFNHKNIIFVGTFVLLDEWLSNEKINIRHNFYFHFFYNCN